MLLLAIGLFLLTCFFIYIEDIAKFLEDMADRRDLNVALDKARKELHDEFVAAAEAALDEFDGFTDERKAA